MQPRDKLYRIQVERSEKSFKILGGFIFFPKVLSIYISDQTLPEIYQAY